MLIQSSSSKYILAYDADCAPYTRFRNSVDILDKYKKIDFMLLTEADQKCLLDVIPALSTLRVISSHIPNWGCKEWILGPSWIDNDTTGREYDILSN